MASDGVHGTLWLRFYGWGVRKGGIIDNGEGVMAIMMMIGVQNYCQYDIDDKIRGILIKSKMVTIILITVTVVIGMIR